VPRFTGYVDSWRTTWPGGNSASSYVDVRAMSRMANLRRGAELPDIISCEYNLDSLAAHYTLGEPEAATQASDSSGNGIAPLLLTGSGAAVTFGNATGPGTDGLTAAEFVAGKYLRSTSDIDPLSASNPVWTEAFFLTSSAASQELLKLASPGGAYALTVSMSTGLITASNGAPVATTASTYNDGLTHHLLVTSTIGGPFTTVRIYIDGALVATSNAAIGHFLTSARVVDVGNGWTGTVAQVAYGAGVIAVGRIADHAEAGLTGFAGDTPADRLARLATYAGIPAASLVADTGSATNLPHRDTTGRTPLDLMQEVTATENGTLFDGKNGTLVFQGRDHRYAAAVSASFAPATDLAPVLDDFGMTNEVTATGDGGVLALVRDQASIDDHGYYRVSVELMTTSAEDAYQAAAWRVGTTAQPKTRIPTATANLHGMSAAVRDQILALEIGDRITLINLPSQAPATSMDFFIEGYSEQITHMTHVWTANLSPAAAYVGTFLFDSASRGFDIGTFAY
ncbi:MAG: hypothetical protein AB7V20_14115, partial [Phycisphaerales bacterium]